MWKMFLRRLLILVPQLFAISIFVFFLGYRMPGDALSGMIDPNLSPEQIAHQRYLLGLDDPLPVRYVNWVSDIVLRGDFGRSFVHRRPAMEVIGERMIVSFRLGLLTLLLTYAIGVPLGVIAGRYKGQFVDKAILFYIMLALSTPALVLGIINILVFALQLGWFPPSGSVNAMVLHTGSTWDIMLNRLHHMILPAMTGALVGVVGIVFMLRANIIDRTYSEYVKLARSKGVPTGVIFRKHILRNSIIPITAFLGLAIVGILFGTVFIEQIFQYPGMGSLFISSINAHDFTVVNALILIFSALGALGMFISDVLLTIVDPRIRIQ